MKKVFENVIAKGGFDLVDMMAKIDSYHIGGKLTDADRAYLYAKARDKAKAKDSIDLYAKLMELEGRIRELENGIASEETAAAYVAGKWYYAGDKVLFDGAVYSCIAPAGSVCTWSPDAYPAYWDKE